MLFWTTTRTEMSALLPFEKEEDRGRGHACLPAVLALPVVFVLLSTINPNAAMEPSPPTAEDTTEEKLFYYVELSTGGGSFYVQINGTPFMQARSAGGEAMSSPVNVRLVEEDNEIHIVAGPAKRSRRSFTLCREAVVDITRDIRRGLNEYSDTLTRRVLKTDFMAFLHHGELDAILDDYTY